MSNKRIPTIPVVEDERVQTGFFLSNDSHRAANIESQYKLNIRIITHTVIPTLHYSSTNHNINILTKLGERIIQAIPLYIL